MIKLFLKLINQNKLVKKIHRNEGFTVIELILAIAIAGIIMGAVGSYLVFSLNSFNDTKDVIDIQYEGQLAINQLTDIARESTGVTVIKDSSGGDALTTNEKLINPTEIIFEHTTVTGVTRYSIIYPGPQGPKTMSCSIDGADSYVIADHIASFQVAPTNTGSGTSSKYNMAKSLIMYFDMADGDATMSMQSEVKFRNYNK